MIPMESGRKGREVIRSGPVPLRRDTEVEGDYMGRNPPWGLSHILGTPALGSDIGKMRPRSWLENQWVNKGDLRNVDSDNEGHAHTCLLLEQDGESILKLEGTLVCFL